MIAENQNICLIFYYNYQNFYEIGYLDANKNFIIDYIIKESIGKKNELREHIINILKSKGIKHLLDSKFKDDSAIWLDTNVLGHFYYVNENKIDSKEVNNEVDEMIDDEFVNNIISFIISKTLFNNEIKEYINKKYIYKNQKHSCYLLNKTLFTQFKKLISYVEISNFFSQSIKSFRLFDSSIQKIKKIYLNSWNKTLISK